MKAPKQHLPFFAFFAGVVNTYYFMCSEGTRHNIRKLGKALAFTVGICGTVFAASICEFWLGRQYIYLPIILIGTGMFYYILDQCIILGDHRSGNSLFRHLRVVIALIFGLFNSFLIDYYFFYPDIAAARSAEITANQQNIRQYYIKLVNEQNAKKTNILGVIDKMQLKLSGELDSLNKEANGQGGSGHRGISTIYLNAYKNYQSDSIRFNSAIIQKQKEIGEIETQISNFNTEKGKQINYAVNNVSTGINKSLELLHEVIFKEGKVFNMMMSFLLLLISMLMELVPLLAKGYMNIDEYFTVSDDQKEIHSTNSIIAKQYAVSKIATKLNYDSQLTMLKLTHEHSIDMLQEDIDHSKNVMAQTDYNHSEIEKKDSQWLKKPAEVYALYFKPVIDKAYQNFSASLKNSYTTPDA
jgi:hypothetical protein